jgi:hypothetical protein
VNYRQHSSAVFRSNYLFAGLLGIVLAISLQGKSAAAKPVFHIEKTPRWVRAIPIPGAAAVVDGDVRSGSAANPYLLFEDQIRFDGRITQRYHHSIRHLASSSGLETLSQVQVEFDASCETLVWHHIQVIRDGKTLNRLDPSAIRVIQREARLEEQIERRFGDCKDKTLLLATLLHAADIPAALALVSVAARAHVRQWAPSPAAFNHTILRVGPIDGVTYWIDPTTSDRDGGLEREATSPFETALVLDDKKPQLVDLPAYQLTEPWVEIEEDYKVPMPDTTSEAALDVVRLYRGDVADEMRRVLDSQNADEGAQSYLSLYRKAFPAIVERAPLQREDDREHGILRVRCHYAIPHFWSNFESKSFRVELATPALAGLLRKPSPVPRKAPLAIGYPADMRHLIRVALPFDLTFTPEKIKEFGPGVAFEYRSSYENRQVRYEYRAHTFADSVAASELSTHLDMLGRAWQTFPRTFTYRPELAAMGLNWPAVVALLVCLPLFLFGARYIWNYNRAANPAESSALPKSLGGGLLLITLRVVCMPLALLFALRNYGWLFDKQRWLIYMVPDSPQYKPWVGWLCLVDLPMEVGFVIWSSVVAALFFSKRRTFPLHFTLFSVVEGIYMLFNRLAIHASPESFIHKNGDQDRYQMLVQIVLVILMALYVQQSVRAKATFIR